MTKSTSLIVLPVLLLAALLAVVLPGMASHAPEVNISFPAAQSATAPELDIILMPSTKHEESPRVIAGLSALPLNFSGPEGSFEEGSLQIWGGLHPRQVGSGCIALLWSNGGNVWFGALCAPLTTIIQASAIEVAPGQFIDGSALEWRGAWVMSEIAKGQNRKVDDPTKYLTLGQGWTRWLEVQRTWGLNFKVLHLPVPLPPA